MVPRGVELAVDRVEGVHQADAVVEPFERDAVERHVRRRPCCRGRRRG